MGTEENGAPEEEVEKDVMADDDEDEDLDLFGEMSEEEKAAAEAKKAAAAAKIAKSKESALKAKSMIIIDVKPWDDTTGHINFQSMYDHMGWIRYEGIGGRRTCCHQRWSAVGSMYVIW